MITGKYYSEIIDLIKQKIKIKKNNLFHEIEYYEKIMKNEVNLNEKEKYWLKNRINFLKTSINEEKEKSKIFIKHIKTTLLYNMYN